MSKIQRYTILIIFAFSGGAGLIYETIWSHYLGLFLGHAAYSQTLTLTIFMGGMALGAWATSKYIGKIKNALLLYAAAEAMLGIFGLLFHNIFTGALDFSYTTVLPALGEGSLASFYKWGLCSLLILPQSILLGSTFPLLTSSITRRDPNSPGANIAILYFSNSIGAAAGAIISTFVLLPSIGMPGAMLTASIINIFVGITAYQISKSNEFPKSQKSLKPRLKITPLQKLIFLASAITGAASFAYEIAWIRMLNLALGTTLHAFELMLSAFIAGLAFGGLWIRRYIDKLENPLKLVGYIQVAMGVAAMVTLPLYMLYFDWIASLLTNILRPTDASYSIYNFVTSALSALIMIPSTFFAGMTLPLFTKILFTETNNENVIGKVYSSNTIGAILGIWLATHLGFALLGLKNLILMAAAIDCILGLLILIYSTNNSSTQKRSFIGFGIATVACLASLVTIITLVPFSNTSLVSGVYRNGHYSNNVNIAFYKDGKAATISVTKSDANTLMVISTNGKPDAGLYPINSEKWSPDEPTMILLGTIPLMATTKAKKGAIIGFGSGLTTHVALTSEHIESLDTIEIEKEMVNGAALFRPRNERAYSDPRSHIIFDDAKSYFASKQNKYDFIISEPSNPWVIGVGNLFTSEFYLQTKKYLSTNGVFVQWLHTYEINIMTLMSALKAIDAVFPYYELYESSTADLIIVASDHPISINFKLPVNEKLETELRRVGINSIASIENKFIANKALLSPLIASFSIPTNSDYFPILSLSAPKDRFKHSSANELFSLYRSNLPTLEFLTGKKNPVLDFQHRDRTLNKAFVKAMHIYNATISTPSIVSLSPNEYIASTTLKNPQDYCGKEFIDEINWINQLLISASIIDSYLDEKSINTFRNFPQIEQCLSNRDEINKFLQLNKAVLNRNHKLIHSLSADLILKHKLNYTEFINMYLAEHYMLSAMNIGKIKSAIFFIEENSIFFNKVKGNFKIYWINVILSNKKPNAPSLTFNHEGN